ncbi:MAG: hypothetical protein ACI82O_004527, partial [Patiriisocius sp.]
NRRNEQYPSIGRPSGVYQRTRNEPEPQMTASLNKTLAVVSRYQFMQNLRTYWTAIPLD